MRIQKTNTDGHPSVARSRGNTDKGGDRFSKILEERRKESMPQFNLPTEGQNLESQPAAPHPESISKAPAPADIDRLASEIVDHISSRHVDGMRSIEIQFNSQTLEGLRVSVRTQQGSIAVNFQTLVPRIAGLLEKNLGTLRSALETKGVQVFQLLINRWAG